LPGRTIQESTQTIYYGFDWSILPSREGAAFAVHLSRDATGRIVARRHESFKPYPTKSTDPKTGSHH
jgi:hypothetical protein